jgi:diaminohydroxyphosphoribosylaminopyrimidine deaminase/5-amino-6-(5-phosphoribosylamino)uracil reductase
MFDPPGTSLVYCARAEAAASTALGGRQVEVIERPGAGGAVDLTAVLKDLAVRGVNEVHVEAGAGLSGALLRAGLIDEFLVYLAPKLIGPGRGLVEVAALGELSNAWPLRFESVTTVGDDLRIVARRPDALRWLD